MPVDRANDFQREQRISRQHAEQRPVGQALALAAQGRDQQQAVAVGGADRDRDAFVRTATRNA